MSERFGVPRWGVSRWLLLEIPPQIQSRLATYVPRSLVASQGTLARPAETSRSTQVATVSSQVRTGSSV